MFYEPRLRFALLRRCAALLLLVTSAGAAAASAHPSTTPAPARAARVPATQPANPVIDPDDFVDRIDNPYFPLQPGTTFIYKGTKLTTKLVTKHRILVRCFVTPPALKPGGAWLISTAAFQSPAGE